jgi:hypothetical protein
MILVSQDCYKLEFTVNYIGYIQGFGSCVRRLNIVASCSEKFCMHDSLRSGRFLFRTVKEICRLHCSNTNTENHSAPLVFLSVTLHSLLAYSMNKSRNQIRQGVGNEKCMQDCVSKYIFKINLLGDIDEVGKLLGHTEIDCDVFTPCSDHRDTEVCKHATQQ